MVKHSHQPVTPPAPFGRPMIPGTPQALPVPDYPKPAPLFTEYSWRPDYSFPGLNPFLDAAAESADWKDHGLKSRLKSDWFYVQASSALGNAASRRDPAVGVACLERARVIRDALHLMIHAIDDAITAIEAGTKSKSE